MPKMQIVQTKITIRELTKGYVDNRDQGVSAYDGKLDVRPPYQREFVYKDKQRDAVIETIRKDFPLNTMYWAVRDDGTFEVMDGQQRTISIGQYVTGDFSVDSKYFTSLQDDEQEQILNYELDVYQCTGTPSQKLDWFRVINIAGEELSDQELRSAIYHGPWVTDAKRRFAKRGCPAYAIAADYMAGEMIRQKWLETAIKWNSGGAKVEDYMDAHKVDATAINLWNQFQAAIEWTKTTFPTFDSRTMKGQAWGLFYAKYGQIKYDPKVMDAKAKELRADLAVENNRGIYEFLLGGETETKLLEVRVFDDRTKIATYEKQTQKAEKEGNSNCPHCAMGNDSNKDRIYLLEEMDADHVAAWSRGGKTVPKNCMMLCVPHNRSKGNR